MKRSLIALAACAALTLAGCAPVKDADYKSINDFAAAYESGIGGIKCERTGLDINDNGWIQTTCGKNTIIMMFTSDDVRSEVKAKNPLRPGNRWVQGKNWLVEAPQFEAEKAHEVLGGELLG